MVIEVGITRQSHSVAFELTRFLGIFLLERMESFYLQTERVEECVSFETILTLKLEALCVDCSYLAVHASLDLG